MSDYDEIPVDFPSELETQIQKIAEHTGRTRDEVVSGLLQSFLDAVDDPDLSDKVEYRGFARTVRNAIRDGSLKL